MSLRGAQRRSNLSLYITEDLRAKFPSRSDNRRIRFPFLIKYEDMFCCLNSMGEMGLLYSESEFIEPTYFPTSMAMMTAR